jgi:hypothetical protein
MGFPRRTLSLMFLAPLLLVSQAWSDAHGPAFGYSTTVLGAGDSSIETTVMRRLGTVMIGPVVAYGLRENLQISLSGPFNVNKGYHPVERFEAAMPGVPSVEGMVAWRFYDKLSGIATRTESTFFVGFSGTTQHLLRDDGRPLEREPGLFGAAAVSRITRRYYLSAGAGYQYYGAWDSGKLDRESDSLLSSVVIGWRPPVFDRDYPKPDVRFFLETTGNWVGQAERDASEPPGGGGGQPQPHVVPASPEASTSTSQSGVIVLPNSGGNSIFSGPSVLVTLKSVGFQGGLQFALSDERNGIQPAERYRAVVGVSYYFLGGRGRR